MKWRLNSHGELLGSSLAVSVVDTPGAGKERHSNHAEDEAAFDVELDDDYEPPDANLSQPLTEATFNEFLGAHELTVVNFFAPWCIWCRRLEPVYLDAASKVPSLHFHGHTRLAQVDCVANQNFCAKNLVRAYPTLRMYKDVRRLLPPRCADAAACPHSRAPAPSPAPAPRPRPRPRPRPPRRPAPNPLMHRSQPPLAPQGDGSHFEAFTGARTTEALLEFVQAQMKDYQSSHPALAAAKRSARFTVHHGALTEGSDLYRAKMDVAEAQAFCGNNPSCVGFTWHGDKKAYEKENRWCTSRGRERHSTTTSPGQRTRSRRTRRSVTRRAAHYNGPEVAESLALDGAQSARNTEAAAPLRGARPRGRADQLVTPRRRVLVRRSRLAPWLRPPSHPLVLHILPSRASSLRAQVRRAPHAASAAGDADFGP